MGIFTVSILSINAYALNSTRLFFWVNEEEKPLEVIVPFCTRAAGDYFSARRCSPSNQKKRKFLVSPPEIDDHPLYRS